MRIYIGDKKDEVFEGFRKAGYCIKGVNVYPEHIPGDYPTSFARFNSSLMVPIPVARLWEMDDNTEFELSGTGEPKLAPHHQKLMDILGDIFGDTKFFPRYKEEITAPLRID